MTELEIINILKLQEDFFATNETKNVKFRIKQLKILKKLITENEKQITDALYADLKKPYFEAYTSEILITLNDINHHLDYISQWSADKVVHTPLLHRPGKSFILKEPYGKVLIISPWNYPFQLLVAPLIGSISAGNTAILKPSEIAPNTSKVIADLFDKYFDKKYIAVIEGGIDETQILLSQKFDFIFYTGSPMVGKIIMTAAAKHLTPVVLELGGKAHV